MKKLTSKQIADGITSFERHYRQSQRRIWDSFSKIKKDPYLTFAISADKTGKSVGLTLMQGRTLDMNHEEALTLAQALIRASLGWSVPEQSRPVIGKPFFLRTSRSRKHSTTPHQIFHKPTRVGK